MQHLAGKRSEVGNRLMDMTGTDMGDIHGEEANAELELVVIVFAWNVLLEKLLLGIQPNAVVLQVEIVQSKVVLFVNLKRGWET